MWSATRWAQHCAFLFNKDSVAVDRSTVQSIGDPSKRFRHRPLVGSFRAVGPKEAEAFTFTLVNVHNEPQNAEEELDLLDDVYREVRNDGRKEDDVILLGDFGSDGVELGQLTDLPDMAPSIIRTPTTTRGTRLADNIFLQPPFDGRVYRDVWRVGPDADLRSNDPRGHGRFRSLAGLGRV